MLLTITTTHQPAADLGFLLAKNPARTQSFPLSFGRAHVYYPEATAERCTVALLLDLDPIELVKHARWKTDDGGLLTHYVNDRPYVASSFMSVAIARVFGSAMAGRSRERPELAAAEIPLEAGIAVLRSRGGVGFLKGLFEPLGYRVSVSPIAEDDESPITSAHVFYSVTLTCRKRLSELLSHLYVMIPVLDDEKHYWVGDDEVDKLLAKGETWLKTHPLRERITDRFLKHQRSLTREALARLADDEDPEPDTPSEAGQSREEALEVRSSLNDQRLQAVSNALRDSGAKRIIDLGCGEGKLLRRILSDPSVDRAAGVDVSVNALEKAKQRLRLDDMPPGRRERITLFQGSLTYRDDRFHGWDAACAVEVIEHIDPPRLHAFERVVFEFASPATVIVTTPNVEYNALFEGLPPGKPRHRDHRFEWTRAEFTDWARTVARRWNYTVRFVQIGTEDPQAGPPTQMAVFTETAP